MRQMNASPLQIAFWAIVEAQAVDLKRSNALGWCLSSGDHYMLKDRYDTRKRRLADPVQVCSV